MLLDWFTVGAQALNFVILVWLMKRFLYRPIRHAIDVREKRIAAELADADAKKAEATRERDEFERKNQDLDQQRATLLDQAASEANAERHRLLDEARKEAELLGAKRRETLRNEVRDLREALDRRTRDEVFAIARKALTDLATTSLEQSMSEVLTRRLREMDNQAKVRFGEALKTASNPALVRSAFGLPPEQRTAIQNAVNEAFSGDVRLQFETAPDLVSGIELSTNGLKMGWSIADYLAGLHEGVTTLLDGKGKDEGSSRSKRDGANGQTRADDPVPGAGCP